MMAYSPAEDSTLTILRTPSYQLLIRLIPPLTLHESTGQIRSTPDSNLKRPEFGMDTFERPLHLLSPFF